MVSTNSEATRRQKSKPQGKKLDSLTAFRALGQYVTKRVGNRRGKYGEGTLKALGEVLRQQAVIEFPSGDLTALLQAAARVARAFTAKDVRALEKERNGPYRLRVMHLRHLASFPGSPAKRAKIVEKCFQNCWTAKQLHAELKQKYPDRSKGGRLIAKPQVGLQTALEAITSIERYFARSGSTELSSADRQTIERLHAECIQRLRKLKSKVR